VRVALRLLRDVTRELRAIGAQGLEPGGPAARSRKVHAGDVLLMIDGVSVRHMDVPTLSNHILGPAGEENYPK
jgi:C-terminal processing protease CtpA/Prc